MSKTIRRTTVILMLATFCVFALLLALSQYMDSDSYECQVEPIQVQAGDTYWQYVEKYCTGNIQVASQDLVKFYGANLRPTQVIYLPKSSDCELEMVTMNNGSEYVYEECK